MTDDRKIDPSDLDRRLSEAQEREAKQTASSPNAESRGWAAGVEFIGCVLVGGLLGYGIDRYFGTAPWAMIVLFLLGFVAGIRSVMRQKSSFDGNPNNDGNR